MALLDRVFMLQRLHVKFYPPELVTEITQDGESVEKQVPLPQLNALTDIPSLAMKIMTEHECFLPSHEQKLRLALSQIRDMQLIQFSDYKIEKSIKPHVMPLLYAEINKSGEILITSSYDRTAKIFSTLNGHLLGTLSGHNNAICHCCFNLPVGNLVSTSSHDRTARIWDIEKSECL